jgi:hypothetical protein
MQGSQEASAIPVTQQEYFDVVYWSASQFHGRRQPLATTAAQSAESTLGRLGIDADAWQQSMNYFHRFFHQAAGSPQAMIAYQSRRASSNQVRFPDKWIRGLKPASRLFGTS